MHRSDSMSTMSSENESNPAGRPDERALDDSLKRDLDTLFVKDDDGVEGQGSDGNKRFKSDEADVLTKLNINADGYVNPYDSFKSEGRPRLAIYHPKFQKVEKLVTQVCDEFLAVVEQLREQGYQNEEIERICVQHVKVFRLPHHKYPKIGPIALLGPSGIGKSSFVNCLFDQRGAALESDSTHRGTNVVHEYARAPASQLALYQVAAVYHRESQIETTVKQHCRNIFNYIKRSEDDDEEEDEADLQESYTTGIDFLRTILCNHAELASKDAAQEYFEDRLGGEEGSVVKELKKLIEDFKKTRELEDDIEYYQAENDSELANIFRQVSRVPKHAGKAARPHPWPIIPKVQVQQDKDLLNAGLVLADTPGVTDTNRTVVDATTNYLKKAGTVLVFENIKRIDQSPTLDGNLRECIRLGKIRDTHLIVTNIDEISKLELSQEDRDLLNSAEVFMAQLKAEEKTLKQDKAAALDQDNPTAAQREQERAINSCLEAMPVRIALTEAKIRQITIEIRNRDVLEELRGKFRDLDRSKTAPDLPVHFISNTQYQIWLSTWDPKKPPILDVEGTGISGVRRMLYEILAHGKSNTLNRICRSRLPSIFNGIIGVLTKSRLERKQDVEKVIVGELSRYTDTMEKLVQELNECFKLRITSTLDENRGKWEEKSEKVLKAWTQIHAGTFVAFCRRSGHWKPKKGAEMISWNEKIQNIFADKLVDGFHKLEDDIYSAEINTVTNVSEMFKTLEKKLEECEDFQGAEGTKLFFDSIHTVRDIALKDVDKLFHKLRISVENIRHDCILDSDGSFVATAMQHTYEHCLTLSNPNQQTTELKKRVYKKSTVHPRRVDCIREKLKGTGEDQSVFADVAECASKAFNELMTAWANLGQSKLEWAYDFVVNDFNTRFETADVKTEEDSEFVETLKEAACHALAVTRGEMDPDLRECEEYEKSSR